MFFITNRETDSQETLKRRKIPIKQTPNLDIYSTDENYMMSAVDNLDDLMKKREIDEENIHKIYDQNSILKKVTSPLNRNNRMRTADPRKRRDNNHNRVSKIGTYYQPPQSTKFTSKKHSHHALSKKEETRARIKNNRKKTLNKTLINGVSPSISYSFKMEKSQLTSPKSPPLNE